MRSTSPAPLPHTSPCPHIPSQDADRTQPDSDIDRAAHLDELALLDGRLELRHVLLPILLSEEVWGVHHGLRALDVEGVLLAGLLRRLLRLFLT